MERPEGFGYEKTGRPEGFGAALRNLSNEIINFGTALQDISDQFIQELDETIQTFNKETYKTLEEAYTRWQSQPATEEQWEQMTKEIKQATEREYENRPTRLENIPEESETLEEVFTKWRRETLHGATKEMYEQMHKEIRHATAREYNIPLEDLPDPIPWSFSSDEEGIPPNYHSFVQKIVDNKKHKQL